MIAQNRTLTPLVVSVFLFAFSTALLSGCGGGNVRPGQGDVSSRALMRYLRPIDLDTPEIANEAAAALNQGRQYRKRVKDRRDRTTGLTIRLDRDRQDVLYIRVYRDETCPDCEGSGRRAQYEFMKDRGVGIATTCLTCKGTGVLKNHLTERQHILGAGDYVDTAAAEERMATEPYEDAPPETEAYVQRIGGDNPVERLRAALWLDRNYVRPGVFFRNYLPLLNRARTVAPDPSGEYTIYQFWAGRDVPGQEARAYWRIYVETKSGQVAKTEFAR